MEGLSLREGKEDRQIESERQEGLELNQRVVDEDNADIKWLAFGLLY